MTTRAVRAWDAFLVWIGVQSRHRSSLTATRVPGHTPRHRVPEPPTEPSTGLYVAQPSATALITAGTWNHVNWAGMEQTPTRIKNGPRPTLHQGETVDPLPDTSRPRPGSLTEMGQKIADNLAPWTDRADDTVTLPAVDWVTEEFVMPKGTKIPGWVAPVTGTYQVDGTHPPVLIKDEPHYGLIDYLDRYGSATKIGGTA